MRGAPSSPGMSSSSGPIAAAPTQVPGMMAQLGSRTVPWSQLATASRGVGLLLLFLGTLVAVLFASFPADCFTMTCTGNDAASVQYGILASRLLWTLGAFGLVAGAALKLHYVLEEPRADGPEATQRYIAHHRADFLLLLVGIAILLLLLLTAQTAISPAL